MNEAVFLTLGVSLAVGGGFAFWQSRRLQARMAERERGADRRMYELAILKELGERIGYSLNMQNIAEVITGSLHQFIEYSVASHMILDQEKIIFRVHLERSVSRKFIDEVRDRMLRSLGALLNREFARHDIEEVLSGAIIVDELEEPPRSFFNIPLAIGERVVGVLTVAHTIAGLYREEEMTILYKITQRAAQAVEQLQEVVETEQRKLNAMVESMTEGVLMTDPDYRIMVVNPAAKRAVGLSDKAEVSIFDFIDRLGGAFDIRGRLEESVKLDKVMTADDVLIGERFYKVFVAPVKSSSKMTEGKVLGGVVLFHDITHEKEVERLREDFTSMMVHELRSPLDNIKKISELLRLRKEAVTPEYLQMIYDNSSRMLELVSDLLDIAKLEAGKFEIERVPTNLADLVAERVRFFRASATASHVTFETVFDPALPQTLELDPVRIAQVFNNLISNALKFTPASGKVSVQAFVHRSGGDVLAEAKAAGVDWLVGRKGEQVLIPAPAAVVAVTDTGVGIPADYLPKLFTKFSQSRHLVLKRDQRDTGLGLAVTKGVVEAHGGIVGVAAAEGAGSTFYFTLPLADELAD